MRALDGWTIEHGTPGHVLMERAGAGAALVLRERLRRPRGPVVVVCGRGNNGGAGFVVARHLRRARVPVEVWLAARPEEVWGDAARMRAAGGRGRGGVRAFAAPADVEALARRLARAAAVVDALFGTGLNAPVAGVAAAVIAAINACGAPVLAVDIASGLSADTGAPLGAAVRATVTATFGYPKVGQLMYPGVEHTGLLAVVDIGIPREALAAVAPGTVLLESEEVGAQLPPRRRDAHKGDFGHVLVIAGSRGKTGAALLAAQAVATPTPGGMARSSGGDPARVQADRLAAARAFARAERVVVVLKGARTVIASPAGATAICPTGNPGMASGGTGDVLAGVIGALLAQGLAAYDAATLGVFAHGAAGDAVAARQGEVGLLASDLLTELPATLERLQAAARPEAPRRRGYRAGT